MIEVSHLVKKYGSHYAVNDLTFRVDRGQIYGFLGPNGAGKSTTMNIITGYLAPTSGKVKINGYDIQQEPEEAKRCIGYLPEMPPLYADMTVMEYLVFVSELKRVARKQRKDDIQDVMERTGVTEMKDRLIRNLSKGYKQRVGLAQALLGDPEIIILDEPTVGLDPKQIIEMRDLIRGLREKHTVILSSHILSEVSAVCDQILIISAGKLVACDTPEGLTRLMTGEEELTLQVKGSAGRLEEVLSGLDGISGFEVKPVPETEEQRQESADAGEPENGENTCAAAVIRVEEGCDIREEMFYRLAQNRLPILELHVTTKSLEEIFLELTASEKNSEEQEETDETEAEETESEETERTDTVEMKTEETEAKEIETTEEEDGHAGDL